MPALPPGDRQPIKARRAHGVSTFAEDPAIGVPDARIIWDEALDPGTLVVRVEPAPLIGSDTMDLDLLADWLTVVGGTDRPEHAVLSNGWRRIRLDVTEGTFRRGGRVALSYHLSGLVSVEPKLLPIRRLVTLCGVGHFAPGLFPPDRRMPRWLEFLRVADARASGASYRDIAQTLFGVERTRTEWRDGGRSLHSRVRRLVAGAQGMAAGGYRGLLRRRLSQSTNDIDGNAD